LSRAKGDCEGILESMYNKVQAQDSEITLLTRALNMKVEDINRG